MTKLSFDVLAFVYVVVAAPVFLFVAFSSTIPWDLYPQLLVFILAIVLASFLGIQNPAGGIIRATGTVLYAVLYLFNPITALFVASSGHIVGSTSTRGWVTWRACFNAAQVGLSAALGSLVFRKLGGDPAQQDILHHIAPVLAGPIVYQISNNFFVGLFFSRVRRLPFLWNWIASFRSVLFSDLLGIPAAVLLTLLYTRVHPVIGLGLLVVLPFEAWALELYLQRRSVYLQIIESLIRAWELSQPRVRGHARRVADIAVALARELGVVERDVESIEFGALLHDVGMIGLDETLSDDQIPLSSSWMDAHVKVGAEIAGELPRREIAEMVLNHHAPYQATLRDRKSTISLGARIISLAEEVDSRLNGIFPYKEPVPYSTMHAILTDEAGRGFDPAIVKAFRRAFRLPGGEEPLDTPEMNTQSAA